jgi:hypothetical protein
LTTSRFFSLVSRYGEEAGDFDTSLILILAETPDLLFCWKLNLVLGVCVKELLSQSISVGLANFI